MMTQTVKSRVFSLFSQETESVIKIIQFLLYFLLVAVYYLEERENILLTI